MGLHERLSLVGFSGLEQAHHDLRVVKEVAAQVPDPAQQMRHAVARGDETILRENDVWHGALELGNGHRKDGYIAQDANKLLDCPPHIREGCVGRHNTPSHRDHVCGREHKNLGDRSNIGPVKDLLVVQRCRACMRRNHQRQRHQRNDRRVGHHHRQAHGQHGRVEQEKIGIVEGG